MAETTSQQDARAKLWDLIGQFDAAMLVTRSAGGDLSARPMSPIVRPAENAIYVLTEKTTETARNLEKDPLALLSFADNKRYISVAVRAVLSDNRALIEDLWNAGAQAFWPKGPSDPAVTALKFTPYAGEYWDGDNALKAGIKMAIANVTGQPPDVGEHGEVRL